jgi:hypothetical protein
MFLMGPLFVTLLAASTSGSPSGSPIEGVVIPDCDFGQKYQVRHVTCDFVVSNDNDAPRTITTGKPAYPSDSITPASVTVAAHGEATLTASMDLSLDAGNAAHGFTAVAHDGKKSISHDIVARGFVESVLDEPRTIIDYGVVDLVTKESDSKTFELKSDESPNVRLTGILEKPTYLNISISGDGRAATLTFDPSTPWSFVNEIVRFKTDSPVQPEIAIQVQADIHGEVVAAENPFSLGMIRQGNTNEFAIRVTDRSKKALHLDKLSVEDVHAHVEQSGCTPKADDCRLLKLTIAKDQPFGQIHGRVLVGLPDYKRQLAVNVWGLYLKKDTVVKDLSEEANKAAAARASAAGQDDSVKSDLTKALQAVTSPKEDAAPATPPPPPPGHGPLVRWAVVHENLVHGYLIYRADAENGPYIRMTNPPIAADRTPDGSSYQWRDNDAVTGRTYWYYVVTLFNDGKKQRLSGAAKVLAK